jgi:hypothetical protein
MTNGCRKYYLLLLPLVVAFLMSLVVTRVEASPSVFLSDLSSESAENGLFTKEISILPKVDDVLAQQAIQNHDLHQSLIKYRKKYKRLSSATAVIRLPVKNIETIAFNINGKTSYVRPFFLSLLHSFLFRLTPF